MAGIHLKQLPIVKCFSIANCLCTNVIVLQAQFPNQVTNTRGQGAFLAIDGRDANHRDKLISGLRRKGRKINIIKLCFFWVLA